MRPISHSHGRLLARRLSPPGHGQPTRRKRKRALEPQARVLVIALGLSLWLAFGSLVLAVADGLGSDPMRRLLVGLALVLVIAAGLLRPRALSVALYARPWLVVTLAPALMAIVGIDGLIEGDKMGPYFVVTVVPIGIAAVVASSRAVWACVAALELGLAVAVLIEIPADEVFTDGRTASMLGAVLGYPFAALVVVGLTFVFRRFLIDAGTILDFLRRGERTLTPATTQALALSDAPLARGLPAPSLFTTLTPTELRVVHELAGGRRPKQIAFTWGVSLATVRKHISNAKRKTAARTLPELAAMTLHPEWPAPADGS